MSRIAVVGSGVAGIVSAFYLSKHHHVDLFEAENRIGGHTHTVLVSDSALGELPVDTGFIVFNEQNYPHFLKFIGELGVQYQDSDMSFSYTSHDRRFFWGSDFPNGIFSQRHRLLSLGYYRFLFGVHRFNTQCLTDFAVGMSPEFTLGDYLAYRDVPRDVVTHYVLPMTSAIWSGSYDDCLKFPNISFIRFWKNHQLLEIGKGLQWKTIVGGSHAYLRKAVPQISGSIYAGIPVVSVSDLPDGIVLKTLVGESRYDGVVLATHADTACRLLERPTPAQLNLLSPWRYSVNHTILHSDSGVMPPNRNAWSSWNVRQRGNSEFESPISVSYWMNRLQSLNSNSNYFVTLNGSHAIDPTQIIQEMTYSHPIMTRDAMATQSELPMVNQRSRVVLCGSYFGYGFHEDAVASALSAVSGLIRTLGDNA